MRSEMDELDKISLRQIRIFSEILSQSTLMQTEYIKKRYLENALNFDETTSFLCDLNLIQLTRNQIRPKAEYRMLLKKLRNSAKSEQLINEFLVNYSINSQNNFSRYLDQFLVNFVINNGRYEYSPNTVERLKYSGLRNFLIELGLIHLDSQKDTYVIDSNYLLNYFQTRVRLPISPEEFIQIQQERADIGHKAELRVIEYERYRLSQYPNLIAQIEHVAQIDIAAGYDIKSFDCDQDGNPINRFIEVKAVSPWDYRFYWTKNEIETSRLYEGNYYLYLLPIDVKREFNLEGMKIIGNPYLNVYKNKTEWICTNESMSFSLQKSKKSIKGKLVI